MNLFISWSKSRSRAVASALRSWLPDMFQGLNPWLSLDINAGSRWATEVSVQLDACNCGILCVTPGEYPVSVAALRGGSAFEGPQFRQSNSLLLRRSSGPSAVPAGSVQGRRGGQIRYVHSGTSDQQRFGARADNRATRPRLREVVARPGARIAGCAQRARTRRTKRINPSYPILRTPHFFTVFMTRNPASSRAVSGSCATAISSCSARRSNASNTSCSIT